MSEKALFVEGLVMVEDEQSEVVASEIIEMLDGETLENLQDIQKLVTYYFATKANEGSVHRSLSSILCQDDEKKK